MKDLSQNKAVCLAKKICQSLANIRIRKECDLTISIYDAKDPESATSAHSLKCSSDESLVKLIAMLGLVSIALSSICYVCSLFKD